MQPKPMDILKKDRPMAISTTSPLMRAKSGMKKRRPAAAWAGQAANAGRHQQQKSRGMSARDAFDAPRGPAHDHGRDETQHQPLPEQAFHGLASSSPKMRAATSGSGQVAHAAAQGLGHIGEDQPATSL